jgi:hypothetical protein
MNQKLIDPKSQGMVSETSQIHGKELRVLGSLPNQAELIEQTRKEEATKIKEEAGKTKVDDLNPDIARYKEFVTKATYKEPAQKELRSAVATSLEKVEEFPVGTGKSDDIKHVQQLLKELGVYKGAVNGEGSAEVTEALKAAKGLVGVGTTVKGELFGATTALAIEAYLEKQKTAEAKKDGDKQKVDAKEKPSEVDSKTSQTKEKIPTIPKSVEVSGEVAPQGVIERKDLSDPTSPLVFKSKSDVVKKKDLSDPQSQLESKKKEKQDDGASIKSFTDLMDPSKIKSI